MGIKIEKANNNLIDVSIFSINEKWYIATLIMKKDVPIQIYNFFNGEHICEISCNGIPLHVNEVYINNKCFLLISSKSPNQITLYEAENNFSVQWRINLQNKVMNSIIYNDNEKPIAIFKDESSEMFKLDLLTGVILTQQHIFGYGSIVKLTENYFIKSVFNSLEILNKNDWKIVKRYDDIHPSTIANLVAFNFGNLGIILFYKGIDNTMNYFQ